jgi:hypothetical protein
VNNRDKNYTVANVIWRIEQVDASIARYLRALDRADREESDIAEAKSIRLKKKISRLRRQMRLEGDGADGSGRTRPANLADLITHAAVDLPGNQPSCQEAQRVGRLISRVLPQSSPKAFISSDARSGAIPALIDL